MSKSRRSSNASAPCRFDWAPSRWLTAALLALALLAPLSGFSINPARSLIRSAPPTRRG